jgi:hypothetical protein
MTDPTVQHRTFQDRVGVVWRVSEMAADDGNENEERERRAPGRSTERSSSDGQQFTTRPHAWLYFESKRERRRVSSVPNRWKDLNDEELEDLMAYSRPLSTS